ncbi:hypothetical protein P031_gp43 [Pelagibacter phage HTVC031P]|nr:hypothetical protein P031_gp43 [Pelagibacter phage HTVC031P]
MAYTTIKKPSDYFNTKLYTGDGSSSRSITGVGFQPDWVWFKQRSGTQSHTAIDAVRTGNSKLRINANSAEFTGQSYNFNSDGFGWTTQDDESNQNGATYASWNWKANGAGSANTDGSISSTVSVNTTSGFSIVSYTGTGSTATVGHGLGSAPKMVIVKNRSITEDWFVLHTSASATAGSFLKLNATDAVSSGNAIVFNNTNPTSTVFTVGTVNGTNGSGNNMIAYCFAEKTGYSKFGSYTGNGNADGTFVYTGFKPSWVIIKRTDSSNNWLMYDNKRTPYNVVDKLLIANSSGAEATGSNRLDLVSNGFKIRINDPGENASGGSYIYMAFAEEPLVGDNPCTAR